MISEVYRTMLLARRPPRTSISTDTVMVEEEVWTKIELYRCLGFVLVRCDMTMIHDEMAGDDAAVPSKLVTSSRVRGASTHTIMIARPDV